VVSRNFANPVVRLSRGLALGVMLAVASTSFGADVYVKSGGTGKGASPDDAFGELWKAVERAKIGDVIHVAAGRYNGKGGAGHFTVKVPDLTLVGGYDGTFSQRDPFKNLSILERAKDYRGDWTGLPEGIVAGDEHADHSGLTVDGFVLDGRSRNVYSPDGTKIELKGSYKGVLFQTNHKNTKLRNSILLNPCGSGIYCAWQGEDNEVTNCFVLNTMFSAIETRSAQPDSKVLLKNNTIAFGWNYPTKGGSIGIFVGRQGQTIIENNVIALLQGEGGEGGIGVINGFGNEDTIMKNNLFFSCTGGFYKYMDGNKDNLLLWKGSEFESLNDEDDCEDFMLAESGDNREGDPGLKPDMRFATIFANFVESVPGKLNMDFMNQWRRSVGLPLQAEPGSARQNYAPAYPLDKVVPGLESSQAGVGVRLDGPFATYRSKAAEALPENFEDCAVADFAKGAKFGSGNDGRAVAFTAGIGDSKLIFEIGDAAPRSEFDGYQLLAPGEKSTTRDYVVGYFRRGSEAHKDFLKLLKKKDKYNEKGGVRFRGQAFDFANKNYPYPVGVVVLGVDKQK